MKTNLIHHAATPLMGHQKTARGVMKGKAGYALLMEQGTGKTLTLIDEFLQDYAEGIIDAVCVLAPNGVHENWILDQIPTHVPETIPMRMAYYVSAPNRREKAALNYLMDPRPRGNVPELRILAISYDSLLTDAGWEYAMTFTRSQKTFLIADESQKIKSPDARRTKRALNLSKMAVKRRIATGTAVTNSPLDAFSQFEFLEPECLASSFPVFRAEYCQLLDHGHGMVRHIIEKMERAKGRKMSEREKELAGPKLIAKDDNGMPIYRNLDRLQAKIAAHSFRVLKEDCLDLPEKVFETRYFHLKPLQRKAYELMEEEQRFVLDDETLLATSKLVAMGKLRQITSGFMLMRNAEVVYVPDNPRIELLMETVEEADGKPGIIWGQYQEELSNVVAALRKAGFRADKVNGTVPMGKRREIREAFQAGELDWIVAHPAAMGTGFTLTRAEFVIYYSNGFSLEERLQSEDRAHRIGQTKTVNYRDLVAIDTRDDDVVWALQHKLDTAAMVNGDPKRQSRFTERR